MDAHLEDWTWAQTVVRFTEELPCDALVQSVRAIAIVSSRVVVCNLVDGVPFLPGGTREPSETVEDCFERELAEEAGFCATGPVTWIGAHSGVSYSDERYRPHTPFPLKAWLWGTVNGYLATAPTNPPDAEQVTSVRTIPPDDAIRALEPAARGYSTVLRYWQEMDKYHVNS